MMVVPVQFPEEGIVIDGMLVKKGARVATRWYPLHPLVLTGLVSGGWLSVTHPGGEKEGWIRAEDIIVVDKPKGSE